MLSILPFVVVIPLLGAALTFIIDSENLQKTITTVALSIVGLIAVILAAHLLGHSTLNYEVGGWSKTYGIQLQYSYLNSLLLLFTSGIACLDWWATKRYMTIDINKVQRKYMMVTFLLMVAGYNGIAISNDLFNIFVFTEISSFAAYIGIALSQNRAASFASFNYLITGTIGATLYTIGIGFVYVQTGSLNIDELTNILQTLQDTRATYMGFGFMALGWLIKLAVFPLHPKLMQCYTTQPLTTVSYHAAVTPKIAIYVFIKLCIGMFSYSYFVNDHAISHILMALGVIAIIIGAISNIKEQNIRGIIAWSSVGQIGYILVALGLGTEEGIGIAVMHMFNHAFAKALLFIAVIALAWNKQSADLTLKDLAGLSKFNKPAFIALLVSTLSLVGVPGTMGFISKWHLLKSALHTPGYHSIAVVVVLSSLASLYYCYNLCIAAMGKYDNPDWKMEDLPKTTKPHKWVMIFLTSLIIYFGFETSYITFISNSVIDYLTL